MLSGDVQGAGAGGWIVGIGSGGAEMKSPFERLMDEIEWQEMPHDEPTDIPIATHQGILKIGDFELRVYMLSNGDRVIEQSDLIRFFGG